MRFRISIQWKGGGGGGGAGGLFSIGIFTIFRNYLFYNTCTGMMSKLKDEPQDNDKGRHYSSNQLEKSAPEKTKTSKQYFNNALHKFFSIIIKHGSL